MALGSSDKKSYRDEAEMFLNIKTLFFENNQPEVSKKVVSDFSGSYCIKGVSYMRSQTLKFEAECNPCRTGRALGLILRSSFLNNQFH